MTATQTLRLPVVLALFASCGGRVLAIEGSPTDAAVMQGPDANTTDAKRCSELGEPSGTAVKVVDPARRAISFTVGSDCKTYFATKEVAYACDYGGCTDSARPIATAEQLAEGMASPREETLTGVELRQILANGATLRAVVSELFLDAEGVGHRVSNSRVFGDAGTVGAFDGPAQAALDPFALVKERSQVWSRTAPSAGSDLYDITHAFSLLPPDSPAPVGRHGYRVRTATEAYVWYAPSSSAPGLTAKLCRVTLGASGPAFSCATPKGALDLVEDLLPLEGALVLARKGGTFHRCAYPGTGADANLCADNTQIETAISSGYTLFGADHYRAHDAIYTWAQDATGATTLVSCTETSLLAGACRWAPLGPSMPVGTVVLDHDGDHIYVQTPAFDVFRIAI